jgi:hypothetical protein
MFLYFVQLNYILQNLIFISYLCVDKESYLYYFRKQAKRGQNLEILHIWKVQCVQNFYFSSNFDAFFLFELCYSSDPELCLLIYGKMEKLLFPFTSFSSPR